MAVRAGLLAAAAVAHGAGSAPAADTLAAARAAFRADIAAAYGIAPGSVVVQPAHPGLPGNPFEALDIGAFHAVRADFPGHDPGPQGFAAADGRTVFARGGHGIADLLAATGARRTPPPPADAIVRRLMWVYQPGAAVRLIAGHPQRAEVAPARLDQAGDGTLALVWFITRPGETGTVGIYRAELLAPPGRPVTFRETRLP